MKIRVRAFASLREVLGAGELTVVLPPGADVEALLARLAADRSDAGLARRRFTVAVNRAYAPRDRVLADGDEVALIPPVSGGAGSPRLYEITDRPISLDEVAARVTAPDRGGVTLFVGTVRGVTGAPEAPAGEQRTDHLVYEAYPEMAQASFAAIAAEAQARWPEISAVAVVHRTGRLEVGDISIAIAVAAAHRRETFDACRYMIDRIKQIAPIWKKEIGPGGAVWVEGPESTA